jgi:catechol-2,3-dioxygenase
MPTVIRPTLHHINLKTTRLQEMVDWYSEVVGTEVGFQDDTGAWLSNHGTNHHVTSYLRLRTQEVAGSSPASSIA